jgi:hypothetical protein
LSRDTRPLRADFFRCFPPWWSQRRQQRASCPDVISVHRCQPTGLHHTRIEVQSPPSWRWQSTVGVIRCDLERRLYPRTVLCKGLAEYCCLASACPVRGRGSTRDLVQPGAACSGARAGVQSTRRAQGDKAEAYLGVQRRRETGLTVRSRQAHPARCPVRRQAHPFCASTSRELGSYHTPFRASACHRPPAPACEPRWSRLYPGWVCARSGRATSGRPDGSAGPARRLRRRPP